jgi:hypothetical protein
MIVASSHLAEFVYRWFGVGNNGAPNTAYSFWSGFGSCLGYLTVFVVLWRHVNCHTHGCWRVGKHYVDGTPYKVCRKCHPTVPSRGASRSQIHAEHRDAQ